MVKKESLIGWLEIFLGAFIVAACIAILMMI